MPGLIRQANITIAADVHVEVLHDGGHLVNQEIAAPLGLNEVERRRRSRARKPRYRRGGAVIAAWTTTTTTASGGIGCRSSGRCCTGRTTAATPGRSKNRIDVLRRKGGDIRIEGSGRFDTKSADALRAGTWRHRYRLCTEIAELVDHGLRRTLAIRTASADVVSEAKLRQVDLPVKTERRRNGRRILLIGPVNRVEDHRGVFDRAAHGRSEEHTSELQSQSNLVCRLLLEKKKIGRGG